MDTAQEKVDRRSAVESQYNGERDAIERQFILDKGALEAQYAADIKANREAKQAALVAVDLNPDGSDPQERQQGSAE